MHPIKLEGDEMQDYPLAGWIELIETLKRGSVGAQWRCHGVSRGVRDKYYEMTHNPSWVVHKKMAMHRPNWSAEERDEKVVTYGGSRQNPDFKRNIYGEHGDATNPVFVLARLMACVDQDQGDEYNSDIYSLIRITYEELNGRNPIMLLDGKLPAQHKTGWSEAPRGYSAYYAGMDVGATNHPSEILIFGQRAGEVGEKMDCLTRVHMQRISMEDQEEVIAELFRFYGPKLLSFGIDRTGVGFPLWERLAKRFNTTKGTDRVKGYNFSAKYAVAFEDRAMEEGETQEDLVIERNIVEFASDALREVVDAKGLRLPFDRELLSEWQGQSYVIVRTAGGGPYGRRSYSDGSFHCVDEATEIMTMEGWRHHDDVSVGDPVLTLDMETGGSHWSPVQAVSVFDGPDHLVSMETGWHSSLSTTNHRWPVRTYHTRHLTHGPLHYRTTMDLSCGSSIPVSVPFDGFPDSPSHSDDFVELLAWYWTEGNCTRSNTNITQSLRVHPDHCDQIRGALIGEFGMPGHALTGRGSSRAADYAYEGLWHERVDRAGTAHFILRMEAGRVLRALAPERVPTPAFIRSLTKHQLDLFLRVSELGDGNHAPGSPVRAFQHLRDEAQNRMLEMVCALSGIGTSSHIYERDTSTSGVSVTTHLLKNIHIRPASHRLIVPYTGKVWCPSTADGNWLARRNGTAYWTGNSLDAGKMFIAGKRLHTLDDVLAAKDEIAPVMDVFLGAM